jgi:curved DNA-binding protein CbpA
VRPTGAVGQGFVGCRVASRTAGRIKLAGSHRDRVDDEDAFYPRTRLRPFSKRIGMNASILVPPGFSAAKTFCGARPGFVFKRGVAGQGYYPDVVSEQQQNAKQQNGNAKVKLVAADYRRCHYDILSVTQDASEAELKRAYRQKALEWHPDRNAHDPDRATAEFQIVQAAYAVLTDPNERAWYDLHRDEILAVSKPTSDGEDQSSNSLEPAPLELFAYFSPSAYHGYTDDVGAFFPTFGALFHELDLEESAIRAQQQQTGRMNAATIKPTAGTSRAPEFGRSSSSWAEVDAFYAHWRGFQTARTYLGEAKYDAATLRRPRDRDGILQA